MLAVGGIDQAVARDTEIASAMAAHLADVQAARVYRDTAQSIPNNTETALSFTLATKNDGGVWSAGSPTRLTAPVGGWYLVVAHIYWDTNATGYRALRLRWNGSITFGSTERAAHANARAYSVTSLLYLFVGDYAEAIVFQNSGGVRTIRAVTATSPHFAMIKLAL